MIYLTLDVKKKDGKPKPSDIIKQVVAPFQRSQNIRTTYERALRNLARQVGNLIIGYEPEDILSSDKLRRALFSYADVIGPWSLNLVRGILRQVDNQDMRAWEKHSKQMSSAIISEIRTAPTGEVYKNLMETNVALIKSIPLQAARKVHEMVTENLAEGKRAHEIAEQIMRTNKTTLSRATMIARTEIARASSTFTQSRAEYVGSPGYVWKTSKDLIVRKSHRKMEGKFVKWDEPPELDKMVGHAGGLPNCRCWPDPVL